MASIQPSKTWQAYSQVKHSKYAAKHTASIQTSKM